MKSISKLYLILSMTLFWSELSVAMNLEEEIIGIFEVVTIRNANDVDKPADLGPQSEETIGQTITFTKVGLKMEGMSCQSWEVLLTLVPVINPQEPMLNDIHVPPAQHPKNSGDQRIGKSFHYLCEGESFMHVYQVDKRVLIIPWNNNSQYLIAEKKLSIEKIEKIQTTLKDYKFYSGAINGKLDDNTLMAISLWSNYLLEEENPYNFKRTAITENLLDTLGLLN